MVVYIFWCYVIFLSTFFNSLEVVQGGLLLDQCEPWFDNYSPVASTGKPSTSQLYWYKQVF